MVNSPEYADLAPSQIVPKLADEGIYLASESTIYKILKQEKMNTHRARTSPPVKREPPTHIAIAPNQVWTWDITWLNAVIKGHYYKLYLIIDMFSRLIVAYEVWEEERAEHAEYLIRKATLSQGIAGKPLVLHLHSGIKFLTPYQRHNGLDKEIMGNRIAIYEEAKARNPERWSKNIRDWTLPEYVSLNPIDEEEVNDLLHKSK